MRITKLVFISILLVVGLSGCGNETLMDIIHNKHDDFIREMMHKASWNRSNGKPEDFILVVKCVEEGITFVPSFIVHPVGRDEDYPKDMEMIAVDRDGLCPR